MGKNLEGKTVQVIFSGSVSAQAQAGEIVTITVTKPDMTTEILMAGTLADKSYSVMKQYDITGDFSAKAHGDRVVVGNTEYSAWDTDDVLFTIASVLRTGTLTVTLA